MKRSLCALAVLALSPGALAAEPLAGWEFAVQPWVFVADGVPCNDMIGIGAFGRRGLNEKWTLGVGLDYSNKYDIERPWRLVGLQQDRSVDVIDAKASVTFVRAWAERRSPLAERWSWFWNAGAGLGFVDIGDASGPLEGGGEFDIRTDAAVEPVIQARLGATRRLGERWFLETGVGVEEHFADYDLEDRNSGRTGHVGSYSMTGLTLALGFKP